MGDERQKTIEPFPSTEMENDDTTINSIDVSEDELQNLELKDILILTYRNIQKQHKRVRFFMLFCATCLGFITFFFIMAMFS